MVNLDYKGQHSAPGKGEGSAPLHDLTQVYPEDIYSGNALRYYSTGERYDGIAIGIMQSCQKRPSTKVTVYRAVPVDEDELTAKRYGALIRFYYNPKYLGNFFPPNDKDIAEIEKKFNIKKLGYELMRQKTLEYLEDFVAKVNSKPKIKINSGDWVTITKQYAIDHGNSSLRGKYKILQKMVLAKQLYTDANSIHEWGYWK